MKKHTKLICAGIISFILVLSSFFVQMCTVSGESMYPTFDAGNLLLMNKVNYKIQRMDVVVVKKDGHLMIKRVVGLPEEKIEIENNKILINQVPIEDIVNCETDPGIAESELSLKDGEYFVLGDNRSASLDSRDERIGIIKESEIVGKVIFSIFPFRSIE